MRINSAVLDIAPTFPGSAVRRAGAAPWIARLDPADRRFVLAGIVDWDGIIAFVLFSLMLFILQFGSAGAALFSLVTLAYGAAKRRSLTSMLAGSWYLLLFPAFAFLSTLWSAAPGDTLKHAAEYALTIFAAMLIASAKNQKSSLWGIFAAFFLYTAISVAFGNMVDVGDYGARALSGLNDSKNEEADMAVTGLIVSSFLLVVALRSCSVLQTLITTAAAALQSYVAVKALSAGAMAAAGAALLVLLLLLALRSAGKVARGTLMAGAAFVSVSVVGLIVATSGTALQSVAGMFGKDPTLTGRTYLWFRARDLIAENPLLGKGFGAFWRQGNLDAEGLWQFARITSRTGFNFHNTLYDVLVSLGWIGALVLGFTFAFGLGRLGLSYVKKPTLTTCFWLAMAANFFIRMPTECVGMNEFYFSTVLLFALLARKEARPTRPTPRRVRPAYTAGSYGREADGSAAATYEAW